MKVKKRDGRIVPFDGTKIKIAIEKAFKATKTDIPEDYEMGVLLSNVYAKFKPVDDVIDIEDIQDIVEKVLAEGGYFEVAKAYVLYRESHSQLRKITDEVKKFSADLVSGGLGPVKADTTEFHDPQAELDVIKNQNASVGSGTVGAAILQESEAITKLFWESKYDPEIRAMSQIDGGTGEIYIHDMGFAGGYCAGWSLKDLILKGIGGVPGKIASAPAKHLHTLCNQMVNFLGILQNEWAG